jgi:hypothetical protein
MGEVQDGFEHDDDAERAEFMEELSDMFESITERALGVVLVGILDRLDRLQATLDTLAAALDDDGEQDDVGQDLDGNELRPDRDTRDTL